MRLALKVLVGMSLAMLPAACSPTQDAWLVRAEEGLRIDADNDAQIMALARRGVEAEIGDAVDAAYQDIRAIRDKKIVIDGKPLKMDDQWLDESMQALLAQIETAREKLATLRQAENDMDDNRESIAEAVQQARRLNKAWATSAQLLEMRITELVSEIRALRKEK